ncbi:MAG: DUF4402 domain-containing protein [Bacteroidota bacterium]|nr:DUF4402 domain-containing protein [Bacteroidota bacterium]
MKKNIFSIVALAAMVVLPMSMFAAGETTATFTDAVGKATIICPLTLTYDASSPLDFGTISSTGTAFTVTADAKTSTWNAPSNGATYFSGTKTFAKFTIAGAAGASYSVTLPSELTLTKADGSVGSAGTVTLKDWNTSAAKVITNQSGDDFLVGATLTATANATGSFQTNFSVTVAYN